jgi:uncharacterized membrane protein
MANKAVKVAVAAAAGAAFGAFVARKRPGSGKRQVTRGVTIDRPSTQVYEFLRDPAAVLDALDGQASKWVRKSDPQIMESEPGRLLSWRATEGPVPHTGQIRLADAPGDRGTELMVTVSYDRPVFGKDPDLVLRTNLRRIKQMIEAGTIIEVQGQPTGRGLIQERLTRKVQDKLTVGGRP